jgi:hypothetical protein
MHGVAATFPPNLPLEEGNVDQQLKLMQQESNAIASVISENTKKPIQEVRAAIARRTVLAADEAKQWGLVHEIKSDLYGEGADLVRIGDAQLDPARRADGQRVSAEITYSTNTAIAFSAYRDFFTAPIDGWTLRPDLSTLPPSPPLVNPPRP